MGAPFYRGGKLVSADTFQIVGERVLVGSTAETVWGGAATTRPTPGNIQLGVRASDNARRAHRRRPVV